MWEGWLLEPENDCNSVTDRSANVTWINEISSDPVSLKPSRYINQIQNEIGE
tara:strand:+ start:851 stop:1006 length:156 start_codon:yes stop_codon:yes gene_type:complete